MRGPLLNAALNLPGTHPDVVAHASAVQMASYEALTAILRALDPDAAGKLPKIRPLRRDYLLDLAAVHQAECEATDKILRNLKR